MFKTVMKLFSIVMILSGLIGCSLDSVKGAFPDQKEAYKKSHELPELEVPPGLTGGNIKDEYDGAVSDETVSLAEHDKGGTAKIMPLGDSKPAAEFVEHNNGDFLLVRDSMRVVWRKVIKTLDDLDYDIEDKNRDKSYIYLNIDESEGGMLAALSFWGNSKTTTYIVSLQHAENGVVVQVKNGQKKPVRNDSSKRIYDDLLSKLGS
ncbi:MAG: hypothetical protein A6F71_06350 [Cycloclasticus sp. symbiont of Poecilosclerida sp. M]|nr:MAG: hypothetical protein A6F71_06350 [Cycloclasticus sp. symbiont of Poecilosclerida sp. M]